MKHCIAILLLFAICKNVFSVAVHRVTRINQVQDRLRGTCGGVYKNQISGYVASPGFPDENYPLNVNCTYIIHAPPGHVIAFESYEMDLEGTDTIMGLCMYDYIKLYDNNKLLGKDVQSYCGNSAIYKNSTSTNKLRIDFFSDFSKTSRGFLIHWKILDPREQPDSFNCSFDGYFPLCPGWKNTAINGYQWTIRRGKTDTANTGPSEDHTTKSYAGRYAFIETSKRKENSTAILTSPIVRTAGFKNCCLRLSYHMYGKTMGGLEVHKVGGKGSEVVARIEGDHGNRWMNEQIDVRIRDRNTKFSFVGRCGPSYLSDIAIDDVTITEGRCPHKHKIENTIIQKDDGMNFEHERCPGNTHFQICAPKCNRTCDDGPTPPPCEEECVKRCACPHHAPIWHINKCIPLSKCPPARDIYNNIYTTMLELISIIIPKTNE